MSRTPLGALIVDDERLARQELRALLQAHPEVHVQGEAATLEEGAALVQQFDPAVVFLDMQLVGQRGFDLLAHVDEAPPIIVVSAHDRYAWRAFEVEAIDYLLKPVRPERLAQALERLRRERPTAASPALAYEDRVYLTERGRMHAVALTEILWLQAADDYVEIHRAAHPVVLDRSTLTMWQHRLPDEHFARIHRSTLVNLNHVASIARAPHATYWVHVRGHEQPLRMSRRYAAALRQRS